MRDSIKAYPLSHLAAQINGATVGDPELTITGLCSLDDAKPNHLCFIRANSEESFMRALANLPAQSAAIVTTALAPKEPLKNGASLILVQEPYPSFLDLVPLFFVHSRPEPGIHPSAVVHDTAHVGRGASIGAHCVIGARVVIGQDALLFPSVTVYDDVVIGDSVILYSGTSIRDGSRIGDRVIIHDHAVIGADGFGYIPDPKRGLRKVPQIGFVSIGNDVEIGAQTCVDRGAFGATIIGNGSKIDNLVQIGHNVIIGSHCIICGQAAIGGSTKIHDGVVVGGAASLADHLEIARGVRLGGRAGVTNSILEPGDYMGFPAIKAGEWRRQQAQIRRSVRRKTDPEDESGDKGT
jgi:UDP-3-O-[3-hydroxymyristoyl] glucosamine N-acyltransferase